MFSFDRELRFGDCDPAGMAYFPAYLNILNGVVEEFWTTIGFPWRTLIMDRKIGTPTVHLDCDFSKPSVFGDLLTFKLAVRRMGRSSLHLAHVVSGEDGLRWKARQTVVATSLANHLAIAWPDDIRNVLLAHMQAENSAQSTELEAAGR